MGSRAGRAAKKKQAPAASPREVERLLAKGRLREAMKAGRRAYQRDPSPANSRALQEALLCRIEQLESRGMQSTAPPLVDELLGLAHRGFDPGRGLVPTLVRLGMTSKALALIDREGSEEDRSILTAELADAAVGDPSVLPASLAADLGDEAATVRAAMERVSAGDDTGARDLLAGIPRRSPFSQWRLFVRGLSAFYNGETSTARQSWARLEEGRLPGRLAAGLQQVAQMESRSAEAPAVALERAMNAPPLLERLIELRQATQATRESAVVQAVKELNSLCQGTPWQAWRQRITQAVYWQLLDACAEQTGSHTRLSSGAERLLKMLEPLTIDPTWDRFRALAHESLEDGEYHARASWERYEAAIQKHNLFRDAQPLARSLVVGHIAELTMREADEDDAPLPQEDGAWDHDELKNEASAQALAQARRSVELCPQHVPNHERLVGLLMRVSDEAEVIKAHEQLLQHAPDHVEARQQLCTLCHRVEELGKMLEQVHRLRELTPLDAMVRLMGYRAHMGLARQEAIAGRLDAARSHLAEAKAASPDDAGTAEHLVKKALLEQKAGEDQRAAELLADAQKRGTDAGAWQLLAYLESLRWQMPAAQRKLHLKLWKRSLSGRTSAARAAAMAQTMASYLVSGFSYDQQRQHLHLLADYLRRSASTGRYTREQMRTACFSLHAFPGLNDSQDADEKLEQEVLKAASRLAQKGQEQFHDLAECHWLMAKSLLLSHVAGLPPLIRINYCIDRTLEVTEGAQDERSQHIRREVQAFRRTMPSAMDGMLDAMAALLGEDPAGIPGNIFGDDPDDDDDEFEAFDSFDPFEHIDMNQRSTATSKKTASTKRRRRGG